MSTGKEPSLPSVTPHASNDVMLGGDHPIALINRVFKDASQLELKFAFHPRSDTVSAQLRECLSDQRMITFAYEDVYPKRAAVLKPTSAWLMLGLDEYDYLVLGRLAEWQYDDIANLAPLGQVFRIPHDFIGIKFKFPLRPIVNGWSVYQPDDQVVRWGRV